MRAAFYTFGCKLNQFETESLASAFRKQGFQISSPEQEAEYYIINTCTVTSRSEQKARRLIRSLSRRHPGSLLIVTGCYAQLNAEAISSLERNIAVVSQEEKDLLLDFPLYLRQVGELAGDRLEGFKLFMALVRGEVREERRRFRFTVERYSFHSRAFLKVQDGCDYRCAYCRIPLARGSSISLEPGVALSRARDLETAGYREVVITGVNISDYRHRGLTLSGLLSILLEGTEEVRYRLSSLEPERIDEQLLKALDHGRICPHFHIPVQSGSDRMLQSMRRRYLVETVETAVAGLRRIKPEAFLGADFIVGFPGENEEDHRQTRRLVQKLGFSRLHVFPFSPRPGTTAEGLSGKIPERVRDRRAAELRSLSRTLYLDYIKRWLNREVEVILEREPGAGPPEDEVGQKAWRGLTGNYLKVWVEGIPQHLAGPGMLIRARIESVGERCRGRYIGT